MPMREYLLLTVFFACLKSFAIGELPPPSATIQISSNTSVCQNSAGPVITFTGSNGTAPYTFTYNINGGAPQTIVSTGAGSSATLTGSTSTAGTKTYNLVSVEDSTGANNALSGLSVSFTVKQQPDAAMGGTGAGTTFQGIPVFRVCSNASSSFAFTNTSTTQSINQTYTIDWGDNTANFTGNDWTVLNHTYNVGIYYLVYTINASNGCSIIKHYTVFVGSNPAVSLGNPGNTDICSNQTLTFPITGTANNPDG